VKALNRALAALGRKLAATHGFDLIHSHDWLVAEAGERLADTLRLPWLVTVHATEHGRHQGWVRRHPQSYIHAAERRMVRRADSVIACSAYMADHIAKVFAVRRSKITAIPNGIDPAEIELAANADLALARERYAQPDDLLVFMVGRLVYEKGFHVALDALAPVLRRNRAVRYVIAGSGSAEADLHAQAERLRIASRGSFLGWIGDDTLHTLYRVADVCLVPSIYEPFGIVALEAMAAGCACIVSDTGGLREIVPADGSAGIRVAPDDPRALRTALRTVLGDPARRRSLATEARAHVSAFEWAAVTSATAEVYAGLLAGVSGAPAPAARSTRVAEPAELRRSASK
jgi:glycogen(starch) synthase